MTAVQAVRPPQAAAPPLAVPTRSWPRVRYGAVAVDGLAFDDVLEVLHGRLAAGYGGVVVTPNTDHLVRARRNPEIAAVYEQATLSLPDGVPLVWMARLLGLPVREKVSGSDLLLPLLRTAAAAGAPVYFLGARPETCRKAAAQALAALPGLRIVGSSSPMVDLNGDQTAVLEALDEARRLGARLVVVALGCPKQELTMARHAWRVPQATFVGLGASLDFLAGDVRRAPGWLSAAGLEWLYRLCQEPRRLWRRYLVDSLGAAPVFGSMVLGRLRARPLVSERRALGWPASPPVPAAPAPTWAVFRDLNVAVSGSAPAGAGRGARRPTG